MNWLNDTETIEILAGLGKGPEVLWKSSFPHITKGSVWWLLKSLSGKSILSPNFPAYKRSNKIFEIIT